MVTAALAVGIIWAVASRQGAGNSRTSLVAPTADPLKPPELLLARVASLTASSMRASRPVLLGSRDPKGPSCVTIVRAGDLHGERPNMMGDYNGGPGTTMATLYGVDRASCNSAQSDLAWHQSRLKTWLENERAINRPAGEIAHQFAERSQEFFDQVNTWSEIPAGVAPIGFSQRDNWAAYCMAELDQAVGKRDLAGVKQWAGELAEAAFSLDDLHRWLEFLCENHLRALAFQQQCESLFTEYDAQGLKYEPEKTVSAFPAGLLSLNGWGNYFEVERQGERLFSMPPDRSEEVATNAHLTAGSLWVTPGVRACFVKLQGALTGDNQKIWEQAAHTPYEHSYLINMLFHAWNADVADDMFAVLKKFDAAHPHATMGEMLGVLMYRGDAFAGMEWADRFQPNLRQAADSIPANESDEDAFLMAARWTNQFYRSGAQYAATYTLHDALEQKKLDCVRATDMIGAIYRNAGRPKFGNVRICAGTYAHSVAAFLDRTDDDKSRTQLADGLDPKQQPQLWPQCYFSGQAWPKGLENPAKPYSAELYVRGLDNYIWVEGYIIRGPNAGTYITSRVPYSTHRLQETTQKLFAGPYPQ